MPAEQEEKTSAMSPNADVGRAALNSSCVTGQVIHLPASDVIKSPALTRLQHLESQSGPNQFTVSDFFLFKRRNREKKGGNLPPSFPSSNSSYRPEAWGLNGGGEKRLNEHSERYLQLPSLT